MMCATIMKKSCPYILYTSKISVVNCALRPVAISLLIKPTPQCIYGQQIVYPLPMPWELRHAVGTKTCRRN